MEQKTTGTEFWQNCGAPATFLNVHFDEGVAYGTDRNGVEYRRARTIPSEQRRGASAFIWQRKMWRMS